MVGEYYVVGVFFCYEVFGECVVVVDVCIVVVC